MDFKISIPITSVADALFDSKVKESQELEKKMAEEQMKEALAIREVAKINAEAKEEYEYNHPTLTQFVEGLKK